jgi:uncharacterized protein with ATP-grasp and redox domains
MMCPCAHHAWPRTGKGTALIRSAAPPLLCGTPGSFARTVFHERHPVLIERVSNALPYGPAQRAALRALLDESTADLVVALPADAVDQERWRQWGADRYGRPWADAPFLWAESFFYRRLLEATGYFRAGAWRGVDPFGPIKNAELAGDAVDAEIGALRESAGTDPELRRTALLRSALWGNRADLGFALTAAGGDGPGTLLVDDSAVLWSTLRASAHPAVCVVADNAGRELLPDLVLIDELLTSGLASTVTLHVKPYPYFVSDATMADTLAVLDRLVRAAAPEAARIGRRLWQAMRADRLTVRAHGFFCAPLPYHDMPDDLRAQFAASDLTVFKGDLNYRRLVGDLRWPVDTDFAAATAYFPTAVAALRTLKSEVVVGLSADRAAALDATGPRWRTDGRHGLIQARPRQAPGSPARGQYQPGRANQK